jgi:hypothetical protein
MRELTSTQTVQGFNAVLTLQNILKDLVYLLLFIQI